MLFVVGESKAGGDTIIRDDILPGNEYKVLCLSRSLHCYSGCISDSVEYQDILLLIRISIIFVNPDCELDLTSDCDCHLIPGNKLCPGNILRAESCYVVTQDLAAPALSSPGKLGVIAPHI